MGKYFGTDGFRGEANADLTAEHAFKIGLFLGWYYGKRSEKGNEGARPRIVVGKDTRRSSYMLEDALSAGACAAGSDVYLLHVTTTPSVSYIARTEKFSCGVMISASHNPFTDNGIKLINGRGEKMEDEVLSDIESYLDGDFAPEGEALPWKVPLAKGSGIGAVIDHFAGRNRYMGYLISLSTCSYRGMRIGLDCANGSTWQMAKAIFDALGADTYVINNSPSGLNINKDCGSTHIEGLRALVRAKHLDAGFAFDGDADRCLAVDENGDIIDGDKILYIFARYMKKRGLLRGSAVVTTVMCNMGLYKALDEMGVQSRKTAVGDKYVYKAMLENGDSVGGETSGHIILRKYAATGDGLLTAIKIMQCIIEENQSLAELSSSMTVYPQVLKNVVVTSKEAVLEDAAVKRAVEDAEKALGKSGRVLLRASGTEPVLRVLSEALSKSDAEKAVNSIINAIEKTGKFIKVK